MGEQDGVEETLGKMPLIWLECFDGRLGWPAVGLKVGVTQTPARVLSMSFAPTIRLDSTVDSQMTVFLCQSNKPQTHLTLLFVVACHFKLQT
jgi:hypothetical protein